MQLTKEELNDIHLALSMRCGFIETGTIHRAKDLIKAKPKTKIKVLSTDQIRAIIRLEDLMSKVRKAL